MGHQVLNTLDSDSFFSPDNYHPSFLVLIDLCPDLSVMCPSPGPLPFAKPEAEKVVIIKMRHREQY
jgi:hypothetical protein